MKKIIFPLIVVIISVFIPIYVSASSGCLDYGMAYDDGTGYCKCMSGYVWGSFLGQPYCVSGSSYCYGKYGYGSQYDSLSSSCKCLSGYVWDDTYTGSTCVSCSQKYGFGATTDYTNGGCKCRSDYVLTNDIFGKQKCTDGNSFCRDKYGFNSSYNSSAGRCECDNGYVFNDADQCVKKQNNVYFQLMELDVSNKKAIIRSDYNAYYSIEYGSGCYDNSFSRYLYKNIVVNLGTDFDLDRNDKIVLQDDDEVCDIRSREKVSSGFTFVKKDSEIYSSGSVTICPTNSLLLGDSCYCNTGYGLSIDKTGCVKITQYVVSKTVINLREKPSTSSRAIGQLQKNMKYEAIDFSNKDWIKIKFVKKTGWVSRKLVSIK